jgi:hypothetical protein
MVKVGSEWPRFDFMTGDPAASWNDDIIQPARRNCKAGIRASRAYGLGRLISFIR